MAPPWVRLELVSREQANDFLKSTKPGTFVVRASSRPSMLALSVRLPAGENCTHTFGQQMLHTTHAALRGEHSALVSVNEAAEDTRRGSASVSFYAVHEVLTASHESTSCVFCGVCSLFLCVCVCVVRGEAPPLHPTSPPVCITHHFARPHRRGEGEDCAERVDRSHQVRDGVPPSAGRHHV
jgi:hypothetical protein